MTDALFDPVNPIECPFCGGAGHLKEDEEYGSIYKVECEKCNAQTDCYADMNEAAEAWNRRNEKNNPFREEQNK